MVEAADRPTEPRIYIIGVGDDGQEGLTTSARQRLEDADLVIGTCSTLAHLDLSQQKVAVADDLDQLVERIKSCPDQRLVVLSGGDPLFFGVARYLCDRLGKDQLEVVPHVSSMQLAFARVKESWDDAFLANLATQPLQQVLPKARLAEKVGLFTTEQITPRHVAQAFLDRQLDYFTAYVCENLGSPDERVTQAELTEIAGQDFAPLNVMVLVRQPHVPDRPIELRGQRLIGNRDEMFLQSVPKRGLLTPMEVRVIALAELDLGPSSVVWDVGAGSGAVAIEAARIAREGQVYAIEPDAEDHQLLSANAQRFQVGGELIPVLGTAPEAWADLPDPDAVFVGGTGRAVGRIVEQAVQRLRGGGRLVVNVNSLDSMLAVHQVLSQLAGECTVRMMQLAHANEQLGSLILESMNPTFLLSFLKSSRTGATTS